MDGRSDAARSRKTRLFQHGPDVKDYRHLGADGVRVTTLGDRRFVIVEEAAVARLTEAAFAVPPGSGRSKADSAPR